MSKRKSDINGWFEVKENPLSKVGVFKYTGAMIDADGAFGLDPDKIYNVFRSEEELSNPETIESFKLVPWINNHVMLGEKKDGLTPAEEKGISGVIGENVFFDVKDQMLKGNVKVFSESLKNDIEEGKKELSLGYRCKYEKQSGVYDGQGYDFMQKCIRGNHMASVDEGRMGSEVAVLDSNILTFTIDSKEFTKMKMTPEEMEAAILKLIEGMATVSEQVAGLSSGDADPKAQDADPKEDDPKEDDPKAQDADPKEDDPKAQDADPKEDDPKAQDADPKEKDSEAMDGLKKTIKKLKATFDGFKKDGVKTIMSEINKRNTLAEEISKHVGTFDHAEMTLSEVAVYGAEKLELKCDKGSELATLNGYLHGRTPAPNAYGLDAKPSGKGMDGLDEYINGDDK